MKRLQELAFCTAGQKEGSKESLKNGRRRNGRTRSSIFSRPFIENNNSTHFQQVADSICLLWFLFLGGPGLTVCGRETENMLDFIIRFVHQSIIQTSHQIINRCGFIFCIQTLYKGFYTYIHTYIRQSQLFAAENNQQIKHP